MSPLVWLLYMCVLSGVAYSAKRHHNKMTNMSANRTVIVQLFEWKWLDIADECERFLGPTGYGAVQTSPASENLIIHLQDGTRTWYERYQVMSYKLQTRSGSEADFLNMTTRCNRAGVRFSNPFDSDAEVIPISQKRKPSKPLTPKPSKPKGKSKKRAQEQLLPTAAGSESESEADLLIAPASVSTDKKKRKRAIFPDSEVRDCKLVGLKDLNQTMPYVRQKIAEYLNKLVSLGVAGFRVDAAKHMWPEDLRQIYNSVDDLNTAFGFPLKSRPFIYQEVNQGGAVSAFDYKDFGSVTEFTAVSVLYEIFNGQKALNSLVSWGSASWNMLPSANALVFVDNHDTQRSSTSLNYKYGSKYQAAVAFLLAHRYGHVRITSSYFFDTSDQGPPSDSNENIKSPIIQQGGSCGGGWVCEHRWNSISRMASFRNIVQETKVKRWWDNGHNQIAFSRGHKGFVAFNIESTEMSVTLQTGLPAGTYCDIRSGHSNGSSCTGKTVTVSDQGFAKVSLSGIGDDLYLAIHIGAEVSTFSY